MKVYKHIILAALAITVVSCSKKGNDSNNSTDDTAYFKTQSEAVIRGKNDLISVLRSTSAFQIAVNQELLQKSHPGISIKHLEVDFDQLLKQDALQNLSELRSAPKSDINTLIVDNNLLTVVQTIHSPKGWTVTGLADSGLSNELSEILNAQSYSNIKEVTLFEIPNLQAFIYQVKTDEGESYFTNYNGFSLKERVAIDQLYPLLHNDALVIERTYGDELKSKNLVK